MEITEPTSRMFIAVHQEDERIKGVDKRRPNLDLSIAVLRRYEDTIELVDLKDFIQDR
jgi:hypothetical protein